MRLAAELHLRSLARFHSAAAWALALCLNCTGQITGPSLGDAGPQLVDAPSESASPAATPTDFSSDPAACEGRETTVAAALRLHSPRELVITFKALASDDSQRWDSPPEVTAVEGLDNDQATLTVTPAYLASVDENGRALAKLLSGDTTVSSVSCGADVTSSCVDAVLVPLLRKLWRRPPTSEEIAWLTKALSSLPPAASSVQRVQAAIRILLLSPQALFRFERPATDGKLLDHERADAISYALTGGPPDAELREAAERAKLRDSLELRSQIRRLAGTEQASRRFSALLRGLFDVRPLQGVEKDAALFPEFAAVASAHDASFDAFAAGLLAAGPTFSELYQATSLPGASGARSGIFTHPAFLASHSTASASKPIHRARAVLERALCVPMPNPPASAAETRPIVDPSLSPRRRFEQMTEGPKCAGCHRKLNPVGFALDGYDAVGEPRSALDGFPIDAGGSVDIGGRVVDFSGPVELMAAVATSNTAKECLVTRLHRHVAGRIDTAGDRCLKVATWKVLAKSDNITESLVEALAAYVEARRTSP